MLMPVVYDRAPVGTGRSWMETRECRSCGDPAKVRVEQFDFPRLANAYWLTAGHPEWVHAELESESKCVWCYM